MKLVLINKDSIFEDNTGFTEKGLDKLIKYWQKDYIFITLNNRISHRVRYTPFSEDTIPSIVLESQQLIKHSPTIYKRIPFIGSLFCIDSKGESCYFITDNVCNKWTKGKIKKVNLIGQYCLPNTGMIRLALYLFYKNRNYSKNEIFYIGNENEDKQAAEKAGIKFILDKDWLSS